MKYFSEKKRVSSDSLEDLHLFNLFLKGFSYYLRYFVQI